MEANNSIYIISDKFIYFSPKRQFISLDFTCLFEWKSFFMIVKV